MPSNDAVTGTKAGPESLPSASWIQKRPDVCGGDACIRNTRITVWGLVSYRNLGLSDARLLEVIDGLTQSDLQVAWDYYNHNRAEIDVAIKANEEA